MSTHRHYWRLAWTTGNGRGGTTAGDRCKCGSERKRLATAAEKKKIRDSWKESTAIHKTWHAFTKKFYDDDARKWRMKGFELSCAVERWAKRHPEVKIARVDDNHFCGSDLVLIPHATKKSYMGTTVLDIAQCSGEEPVEFFLYPSHRIGLFEALGEIEREHKGKKGWRR